MIKWAVVVLVLSLFLVFTLDQQNQVMAAQMRIERAKREKRVLEEKNDRLLFQIALAHNPKWLAGELASGQFSHLVFPKEGEVFLAPLEKE